MAYDMQPPKSKLQELELLRAGEEELADIRHSDALATDAKKVKEGYFFSLQLVGALSSISLSTTASYWGFSPAAAVIANINADIGPSANASLFAIIWSTALAVSIIVFGRTSDKFGRRWFMISASTSGFIGGIIACTAKNMNTLIGANVLLGLGAGVHTCYGLTIGEVCPNKWKLVGVVICVIPACLPTGFGAYLAIQLTHTANWRWIYYIYLMLMGPALILQLLFYRPPSFRQLHGSERTRMQEIKRVDWVGMFLIVSGLVLFLLGVSWGGSPLPWTSSRILGLLITGGILLIIFGFWEAYSGAPNALIPMRFFKDIRGFTMLFIISSVSGTVYIATAIIWPSQVAAIYASSITTWQQKAWASTTVAFGIWGGIVTLGPLIPIIKHVRIQLTVMMAFSVAFMGALVTCNSSNFGSSAAFSFLACFPAGILEVATGILVQLDSNDADLGTVFSIIFLGRSAIGTIFTTVFVAILTNKVPTELVKYVPAAAEKAGLPASSITDLFTAITAGTPQALAAVPGMTPTIEAAVGAALATAYAHAYAYVYYAAIAVGLVGLIACICVKDYDPYFTTHIPRQIYKGGKDDAGAVKTGAVGSGSVGSEGSDDLNVDHEKAGAIHNETSKM